ncbi:MAG: diadenylate cyclase [Rikenellaceae bacterium]
MWFIPFTLRDLLDIFLVAYIFYWVYRSTRGTNAPYILSGLIFIYLFWIVVRALNMELLTSILGQLVSVGVVALIILFQPEIRRFLHMIGLQRESLEFVGRIFGQGRRIDPQSVSHIVKACGGILARGDGALIVLSQSSDLTLLAQGGDRIEAKLSSSLLSLIFTSGNPLSQGAVIVSGSRILSARSILPVTQCDRSDVTSNRSRAALGVSEISDAIAIAISESGEGHAQLSVAFSGDIYTDITLSRLEQLLTQLSSNGVKGEVAR